MSEQEGLTPISFAEQTTQALRGGPAWGAQPQSSHGAGAQLSWFPALVFLLLSRDRPELNLLFASQPLHSSLLSNLLCYR